MQKSISKHLETQEDQQEDPPIIILKSNKSFLRHFMLKYWPQILLATVCSIGLGLISSFLVTLVGPAFMALLRPEEASIAIDSLFGKYFAYVWAYFFPGMTHIGINELFSFLPFLLIGVALFKASLQFCSWYLWEWLGEGVSFDLRQTFFDLYTYLEPQKRTRFPEEQLSASITTDCKLIREYIVHFYGGLPRELLQVVFLLATQLFLSWKLTLIFLGGILPIGLAVTRIGKKLKKRAKAALENYSFLSEWLQQRLLGFETIKHYRTENQEIEQMKERSVQLYKRLFRAARLKARTGPLIQFFGILSMVLVLFFTFKEVQAGLLTGPVALSFFTALAFMSQSAAVCGRYYNSNREGSAAVERVRAFCSHLKNLQKINLFQPRFVPELSGVGLQLKNVSFAYLDQADPAVNQVNLKLEIGRFYALTGPSGGGKSTLAKLCCGLLSVDRGEVLTGVENLRIGYMPQKIELLAGTIAEQIIYPQQVCDDSRLEKAIDASGLKDVLCSLKDGVATQLRPGEMQLSVGQMQRILMARLFYHDFDLIIVDEGTSALDPVLENEMYRSLGELKKNAAILVIAHRPAALNFCDYQVVLDKGSVGSILSFAPGGSFGQNDSTNNSC